MRKVILTSDYTITDNIKEFTEVRQLGKYEDRLDMILLPEGQEMPYETLYVNYLKSFTTFLNDNPNSRPAYLSACGFIPIGIEPLFLCGRINSTMILPALRAKGIEYFQIRPMSPTRSSYVPSGPMAASHDIWVSKIDAEKVVKKSVWNITSLDLLEALLV